MRQICLLAVCLLALPQGLWGQGQLDPTANNYFFHNYNLNSTGGPDVFGGPIFTPILTSGASFTGSQISSGPNAVSTVSYDGAISFTTVGAFEFSGFTMNLSTYATANASVDGFGGIAGTNGEIHAAAEMHFSISSYQHARLYYDGEGRTTSVISGLFPSGFANSGAGGGCANYLPTFGWSRVAQEGEQPPTFFRDLSLFLGLEPGTYALTVNHHANTSASAAGAGPLGGANGTGESLSLSQTQFLLAPTAVNPTLADLQNRETYILGGNYTLPLLSAGDAVSITIDGGAEITIPSGSMLNGSLQVNGTANVTNLVLPSGSIVAAGAGGIVAVGAGGGIVTSGAGGGIIAVGAGGGIIASGAGGGIVAAGAGGMIVASGAGGGIVASGAGGGIVAVGAGGYLTGNGILGNNGNALTANLAAQLAIGHSPGQLTVFGDVNFAATSQLDFEIGGLAAGTEFDWLEVLEVSGDHGAVNLGGAALNLMVIEGFGSQSEILTGSFAIITAEGGISGSFGNVASGQRLLTTDGSGSFLVTIGTNEVTLGSYQAVPEPTTLALLGTVLVGVAAWQRRSLHLEQVDSTV